MNKGIHAVVNFLVVLIYPMITAATLLFGVFNDKIYLAAIGGLLSLIPVCINIYQNAEKDKNEI